MVNLTDDSEDVELLLVEREGSADGIDIREHRLGEALAEQHILRGVKGLEGPASQQRNSTRDAWLFSSFESWLQDVRED